jgi:DNA polymerase-1
MLLIIDVSSIVFRSFYGIPIIFDNKGRPKNAIIGFLKKIKDLKEKHPDATFVACFDTPRRDNIRNKQQENYKGNRKESPEYLHPQFKMIRQICEMLNMNVCELKGYEADDIMASLCEKTDEECLVVTGDKDMLQLLRHEHVRVYNPYTKLTLDRGYVVEKYGVPPEHFDVYLALVGDPADNVKGIPRIGPKRAAKIIQQTNGNINDMCHVFKIHHDVLKQNLDMVRFYDCDANYEKKMLVYGPEYIEMLNDLDIK